MSLADQLKPLKESVVNVFDVHAKNKKSLIHIDGLSITRADAHKSSKRDFKKLCKLDSRFNQFESLYSEDTIDMAPQMLKADQLNEIKIQIKHFLCIVTPYLETDFVINAIEWLVYKFEIHLHQPEDVLMSCVPYHDHKVFVKFIRLLDTKKVEFEWLRNLSKEGQIISLIDLSGACLKFPNVLEMLCGWPMKLIEATNADPNAGGELLQFILCLGIHILDKVKLKGKEKIEKYLGPFIRLIVDGLDSNHEELFTTCNLLLQYFSEGIHLDQKFLDYSIKKILKHDSIEAFFNLRAVIHVVKFQDLTLKPKAQALFDKNLSELAEKDRKIIEEMLTETEKTEADAEIIKMEVDEVEVKKEKKKNTTKTIDPIDWSDSDLEKKLLDLLMKHVVNWSDEKVCLKPTKKDKKITINTLNLLREKPKELVIPYRVGGIISTLCLGIMHPDNEIKLLVRKVIKTFSADWPKYQKFCILSPKKLVGDPEILFFGEYSTIILEELNELCKEFHSMTLSVTLLSMINNKNFTTLPLFENIWTLFLSGLCSDDKSENIRPMILQTLCRIRSSFVNLAETNQHQILDKIIDSATRQQDNLNSASQMVAILPLSMSNIRYLLGDKSEKKTKPQRKSLKKFNTEPTLSVEFYNEAVQDKINVVLSAICQSNTMSLEDQVMIIDPIISILGRTVMHLSTKKLHNSETEETCVDENLIELVKNIMLAMTSILTAVVESEKKINMENISAKIRLEVFSKCLYLFNNSSLHTSTLSLIQLIVRLGLGLDQFNLIYFMSWIGNHLVPREDQKSMSILSEIINETLPLCIKQKKQNSFDKVQIIVKFINECSTLPKHRVLLFFKSIVKSLSISEDNEEKDMNDSVLWIQMLFMLAVKSNMGGMTNVISNECLIKPLLKEFTIEEQLFSLKKIILFLSMMVLDPSRKRKYVDNEISNSPSIKKRKTTADKNSNIKYIQTHSDDKDFMSVKENLISIDKKIDSANLLKTIIKYCFIHLKESTDNLQMASSDALKDFISNSFVAMKNVTNSSLSIQDQNEFCQMFRQIIECVGSSLSRNLYMTLIAELATNDVDEGVKSKCIELLSNKLSAMTASKTVFNQDEESISIAISVMSITCNIVKNKQESIDWNPSLLCITNLVAMGLTSNKSISESCKFIFEHLLKMDFHKLATEKIIIVNLFFKHCIDSDNYNELSRVFDSGMEVMDKCVLANEFKNGELESSLALVHAIISKEDAQSIGWEKFSKLMAKIFELVSKDSASKKLSEQTCNYQKYIRIKLSKMSDTKSLISSCLDLLNIGLAKSDLAFLSGSINLLGCHLTHLNKLQIRYDPDDSECENLWNLVYKSLSLNENLPNDHQHNLHFVQEIAIKALHQLCSTFHFEDDILKKLLTWTQKSDISIKFYLERNSIFFRFLEYFMSKTNCNDRAIRFINESDCIPCASSLLKHLSVEKQSKNKRRRVQSTFVIPFTSEQLITECPAQCAKLIQSICQGLTAHLRTENKCGMNMSISDETIELIGNVCRNMLTIDEYLEKKEYELITEKHLIPLIVQIASNSSNDEALLTPLALGLCKHVTELSNSVHLAVLKTLMDLKTCLGHVFDSSIRDNASNFLEDCKLHDDETITDLANEI